MLCVPGVSASTVFLGRLRTVTVLCGFLFELSPCCLNFENLHSRCQIFELLLEPCNVTVELVVVLLEFCEESLVPCVVSLVPWEEYPLRDG